MKKVLYITFNEIIGNTGGSLGQKKIYLSLKEAKKKGLVLFDVISLDKNIEEKLFEIKKSRISDIFSRICGHSNFLFIYKNKIIKAIKKNKYDVLFLGNSRLGFIAKKARKYVKKIVTHFDNIEYDYSLNRMSGNKIVQKIEGSHVYRDEVKSIIYSDSLMFLSNRDKNRAVELYKKEIKQSVIFPVCLEKVDSELSPCKKPKLIFTGSLNYGPNIDSVKQCIEIVSKIKNASLIVGGCKPPAELIELCATNNVETHIDFDTLRDFAHKGDIVVIPSNHGAGMKVKVADAMRNGLLVVGSKETFIGYEEAFHKTKGLVVCDTSDEFLIELNKLFSLPNNEIENAANANIKVFDSLFSIEKAYKIVEEVLK